MVSKQSVQNAISILRGSLGHDYDEDVTELLAAPPPPMEDYFAAMLEYGAIEFEVPLQFEESDGFLFEYLPLDDTFSIGLTRQLSVVGEDDDQSSYVQVEATYEFALDGQLKGFGSFSEWWFRGEGDMELPDWLKKVRNNPVWSSLSTRVPVSFSVSEDEV